MTRAVWVQLSYCTFGIEVEDGVVVDAAPIARWMIGKSEQEVADWVRSKRPLKVFVIEDVA